MRIDAIVNAVVVAAGRGVVALAGAAFLMVAAFIATVFVWVFIIELAGLFFVWFWGAVIGA